MKKKEKFQSPSVTDGRLKIKTKRVCFVGDTVDWLKVNKNLIMCNRKN
jgi:hypothetical protein